MGIKIHHVLVEEAALAVQSPRTAAAADDTGLRPDTMGHANLLSSRSFILCRFHGHLLFVWSCCHSLTLMSNRSASIFLKVIFSITY